MAAPITDEGKRKQGHTKDALIKYNEALKFAPNWNQLKEAREALAKQKS